MMRMGFGDVIFGFGNRGSENVWFLARLMEMKTGNPPNHLMKFHRIHIVFTIAFLGYP